MASNDLITIDIRIPLYYDEMDVDDRYPVRALDDILAQPRFQNVTRFSVWEETPSFESLWAPEFNVAMMPLASARGILQDPIIPAVKRPFSSARVTMDDV